MAIIIAGQACHGYSSRNLVAMQKRLNFDILEPYAGTWIQAEGEYTTYDGQVKRVAVPIGPDQVKEAAKEAVQGMGFDLLLICGFAFDPHVSEEAKHYGEPDITIRRIKPESPKVRQPQWQPNEAKEPVVFSKELS